MKYAKSILVLAVAVVFGMPMLHAQSAQGTVRATIPFQFSVAGQMLDAGDYVISTSADKAVTIRDDQGKSHVMALSTALRSFSNQEDAKLVFRQVGDRYYLSQVWLGGFGDGREFLVPSHGKLKVAGYPRTEQVAAVPAK